MPNLCSSYSADTALHYEFMQDYRVHTHPPYQLYC